MLQQQHLAHGVLSQQGKIPKKQKLLLKKVSIQKIIHDYTKPQSIIGQDGSNVWKRGEWIPICTFVSTKFGQLIFQNQIQKESKTCIINEFLSSLKSSVQLSNYCYLFSLYYLSKSIAKGLKIGNGNYIPFIVSSIVLASKYWEDHYYKNKEYSNLMYVLDFDRESMPNMQNATTLQRQEINLKILNKAEILLLESLDFSVYGTLNGLEEFLEM